MSTYRVTLEQDGDDVIVPIPAEILDELGWGVDTEVKITMAGEDSPFAGSILIQKA